MTSKLASKHQATFKQFTKTLLEIWQNGGRRPRLGLAISGGVDSMALANLCRPDSAAIADLNRIAGSEAASFMAFIVDHKVRAGSDVEAKNVSFELERLGIESRILDLDWSTHGDPTKLSNMESEARRLRYQVLGRACREQQITSLLFAHHRDDQAEGVFMRMLYYGGSGLRGIKAEVAIPECWGMYGLDHSGTPVKSTREAGTRPSAAWMAIETGGVSIARPLLGVDKAQLVEFCEQDGIQWFEDATNADATLTPRNTIRALLASDDLPRALRKDGMLALGARKMEQDVAVEEAATSALKRMNCTLKTSPGVAKFWIPESVRKEMQDAPRQARLLQRMIEAVTPAPTVAQLDLGPASNGVFGEPGETRDGTSRIAHVAGVNIYGEKTYDKAQVCNGREITIHRAAPTARERPLRQTVLFSSKTVADTTSAAWTEWQLWDGRYWIRIHPPQLHDPADVEIWIRFVNDNDVAALRRQAEEQGTKAQLRSSLALASNNSRPSCPVLTMKQRSSHGGSEERIVALPSLGWCEPDWKPEDGTDAPRSWRWDIRFKYTELKTQDT